jgi:TraM recognition site of TraD and TraG
MVPLKTHHEHPFYQIILIQIRKLILSLAGVLLLLPIIMLYIYDITMSNQIAESQDVFISWFIKLGEKNWFTLLCAIVSGWSIRFLFKRYIEPFWSSLLRKLRNNQSKEIATDIRTESRRFHIKEFLPSKFYTTKNVLVGLGENNQPIYVPINTWYETNMQIIGPTRYGKGVILGCILDQSIRRNDCLFYIDPKQDKFAPHIMYQACKEIGRKFYYLTLHDNGIGKWAPFAGGAARDALARIENAFGLEFSGDPGTDYYKSQERNILENTFKKTRDLKGLKALIEDEGAKRISAELNRWTAINSLCPKKGTGFSIEQALKEGAVVYVQGSLDDSVVKDATKIFIAELIQEARRLEKERNNHLTIVIDEVSFLASQVLAKALATAVGFRVNFVLAYQAQNDLLNIDDKTVNPKYIHQSINVNSQIKAIYGGADYETAEWAAKLSGTIIKEVTKMEKTDISMSGGETWEKKRTIGSQEENYINTNIVLTLPPRICVFVQPRHLASICFSSFIPVKNMADLNEYIEQKRILYSNTEKPKIGGDTHISYSERSLLKDSTETSISHAKLTNLEMVNNNEKIIENNENEIAIDNNIFLEEIDQIEAQTPSVSHAKLMELQQENVSKQEKNISEKSDEELTEEQLKNRQINRARRNRQKTEAKELVDR